jgi:tetratricopeptide (TPR) repeat protein
MTLAAILAAVLVASGSDKTVEATCPVDGTKFKAILTGPLYALGGMDRDHCPHPGGRPRLQHIVWTCPGCLFTGLKDDFEYVDGKERVRPKSPPSEELKAKLRGALTPMDKLPEKFDQTRIPGEIKFDLLAQARSIRGFEPLEIGKAYLQGAWVVRQHAVPSLTDFEEYNELASKYRLNDLQRVMGQKNRADLDLQDALKIEEDIAKGRNKGAKEVLSRYLVLELYRRHGENARAAKWATDLEERKGQNSVVDNIVAKVPETIERERSLQRKAVEQFLKAVEKPGLSDADKMKLEYMIAELHRRLDRLELAREWYDRILAREKKEDAAAKEFFKIVREQRALAELK